VSDPSALKLSFAPMIEIYVAEVQRVLAFCAEMFATEHSRPLCCGYNLCIKRCWGMNFSSSKDESLLWLWESVRRQVLADRASGGRSRCAGDSLRAYAELLRSELNRRELKYTPIDWI
jgi:hypothetical protein